jgi:hypothetical protein
MRAALVALMALGCGNQRTGVVLTVSGEVRADQLRLTADFDGGQTMRMVPGASAGPIAFPTDLFAEFDARAITVEFAVEALEQGALVAAATVPSFTLAPGRIDRVEVQLGAVNQPAPPGSSKMPDGGAAPPAHVAYPTVVMADGPLAYYRLDEASGSIALDSSGHGLHGSYGAGVAHGVGGLLAGDTNGAAQFAGGGWTRDGILMVPSSPMLQPASAVSVELWMRQQSVNPDGAVLVDYGDGGPSAMHDPAYGLLIYQSAFNVYLWTNVAAGGGPGFGTPTQPAPGRVYHVVETFDGQALRIYVDGLLESTMPLSGTLDFLSGSGLGIGGTSLGGGGDPLFSGTIDEVAIYGAALTPLQVMKHFTAGSTP